MQRTLSTGRQYRLLLLVLVLAASPTLAGEQKPADTRRVDHQFLGAQDKILFWNPDQQIASYRNIERIFPTRRIAAGKQVLALPSRPRDLSKMTYSVDGDQYTLDDFLKHNRVAGLLAIKKGRIVLERYALGNDENSLWINFSIAKSVVSMLVGAAIKDGYIVSLDESVTDYLPRLKGSAYDGSSIRNVMQMASGVAWNEDYADPESDVAKLPAGTLPLFAYLRDQPNEARPGELFNYNTAETNLVGALLRAAIGNNLGSYLSQKIWQPFGMEADANWIIEQPDGVEYGGCCISATLRDYGRLGLFAMRGGVLADGTQVLPEAWMVESTRPSKAYEGYGYLWWLDDGPAYSGIGIFGQLIWIDPVSETIIVTQSAWATAVGKEFRNHRWAFVKSLATALDSL